MIPQANCGLVGAGRKVSRGTFRARLHGKGLEALDQKENGLTPERKISSGFHVEQILVVKKAA